MNLQLHKLLLHVVWIPLDSNWRISMDFWRLGWHRYCHKTQGFSPLPDSLSRNSILATALWIIFKCKWDFAQLHISKYQTRGQRDDAFYKKHYVQYCSTLAENLCAKGYWLVRLEENLYLGVRWCSQRVFVLLTTRGMTFLQLSEANWLPASQTSASDK